MVQLFDFERVPIKWIHLIGTALTTKTQNAGDDETEYPIHRDEKKTGEQDHEKNKPRRDQGLPARRPSDLGAFGANLLKKFQRVSHFFGVPSLGVAFISSCADSRESRANSRQRRVTSRS